MPSKALAQYGIYGNSRDFPAAGLKTEKNQEIPESSKAKKSIFSLEGAITAAATSILSAILLFCQILASVAIDFLNVMLKPELYNFSGEKWITEGWIVVRDICNMFFLLVLLFIAFCTILQVEKYHAKKTLLTLIIIALLINFSKPIAIFIFDGSQLLMNLFLIKIQGNNYGATIGNAANIAKILEKSTVEDYSRSYTDIAKYIFSIVFVFMFAVCIFCLAIFLMIRLIAIWMLIILSPMGFFAATVPDFKKLSSSWWDALFKYSYFGPAAAFFIWLSGKLATSVNNSAIVQAANSVKGTGIVGTIFEKMTNFLPYIAILVFLYASLIMAQQFGIQFAKAVTDRANKFMKWAPKAGVKAPFKAGAWGARALGITGGIKQGIGASRFGKYLTKEGRKAAQEDREAKWAERFGVKGAKATRDKKKIAETREKWKKEGKTDADLRNSLDTGNSIEKMAAALELSKQNKIKNQAEFTKIMHAVADRKDIRDTILGETKKRKAHLVAEYEFSDPELNKDRHGASRTKQQVYDDILGNVKPGDWGDQDIDDMMTKTEFLNFAAGHFGRGNMPPAARLELAKNLNSKHAATFKTRGWV